MKQLLNWTFLGAYLLFAFASCRSSEAGKDYDIVIYGGTSAGVIAAYTGKKMGKSVLIIHPDEHIGGLSSGGLGQTDIGNKHAVTGLSRQFYRQLGKIYGQFESWHFEPRMAEKLFRDYLKEADVPVLYGKRIASVHKNGATIASATVVNTLGEPGEELVVRGKVFIDATYEGDLLPLAGVSYFVGREDNSTYNETLSGFQLPDYHKQSGWHQFPDGVSPYKVPGDSTSGLVWGIAPDKATPTGSGDKLVQAYNFRICLTDSVENQVPITRPSDYDSTKYELLARLLAAQPTMRRINDYFIWSLMPKRKTDINNRGGFSTDMIGHSHQWAEATHEERKKIYDEHYSYTKGLLYFMKTDARVPDSLRMFIANWGYPKDEYVTNRHFTPQIYVREGRRLVGEYVMTEHNCRGKEVVDDAIGMAAYTMDSHNTQRIVVNGMVKNEGNVEVGGFPPFPISYRALTPKRAECTNLLVPIVLSSSHIAYGSIRMEPVFMVLAQSAAVAASLAIDGGKAVQEVDVKAVQKKLIEDPYMNGGKRDVLVDDGQSDAVSTAGGWENKYFFGRSYFSSTKLSSDPAGRVTYSFKVPNAGKYAIYYYYPPVAEIATPSDYAFDVTHAEGSSQEQQRGVKHSGRWSKVGEWEFKDGEAYQLTASSLKPGQTIVADAALIIPTDL
jgi:hypothetical protein